MRCIKNISEWDFCVSLKRTKTCIFSKKTVFEKQVGWFLLKTKQVFLNPESFTAPCVKLSNHWRRTRRKATSAIFAGLSSTKAQPCIEPSLTTWEECALTPSHRDCCSKHFQTLLCKTLTVFGRFISKNLTTRSIAKSFHILLSKCWHRHNHWAEHRKVKVWITCHKPEERIRHLHLWQHSNQKRRKMLYRTVARRLRVKFLPWLPSQATVCTYEDTCSEPIDLCSHTSNRPAWWWDNALKLNYSIRNLK